MAVAWRVRPVSEFSPATSSCTGPRASAYRLQGSACEAGANLSGSPLNPFTQRRCSLDYRAWACQKGLKNETWALFRRSREFLARKGNAGVFLLFFAGMHSVRGLSGRCSEALRQAFVWVLTKTASNLLLLESGQHRSHLKLAHAAKHPLRLRSSQTFLGWGLHAPSALLRLRLVHGWKCSGCRHWFEKAVQIGLQDAR